MPRTPADRLMFVAILLTLLLPAGLASAQEHTLSIDRERPVGAKYQVVVKASQNQTQKQTVNGQLVGNTTDVVTGSMTAVAEVLAVHENKGVRSLKLTISKFEGKAKDKAVELDMAKPVIATANEGATTFAYQDGTALPEGANEVLDLLSGFMTEDKPDDATQDQVFKLGKPHAKGSSWEGDNKLMAKQLASSGELEIDPEDIETKFSFLDIGEFAGQPSAVFEATVAFDDFSVAGLAEVPGLTVTKSTGSMKLSGLLPLDKASGDGAIQMQMDMSFGAEIKADGQTIQISVEANIKADAEYREIK